MPNSDSSSLKIELLDVGTEKYGDCLVCELGDRRILIDGAHPGDYKTRGDRPSIPTQLKEIFKSAAPYKFDLLVVTHCHSDHIGCLPTLVSQGPIEGFSTPEGGRVNHGRQTFCGAARGGLLPSPRR